MWTGRLDFDFDILPVAAGPRCIVELANAVRDGCGRRAHIALPIRA